MTPPTEETGLVLADPMERAEVRARYVERHPCENCGSPASASSLRLSDLKRTFRCLACQAIPLEGM